MSYATEEQYSALFKFASIDLDISSALDKASDQIDKLTYNRIRGLGFDKLSEYQKEMVIKATCYQAKFNCEYGDYLNAPVSGYAAGSLSVQFNKSSAVNGLFVDPGALSCLKNSGLMVRRV